jgi:hypothetical protein
LAARIRRRTSDLLVLKRPGDVLLTYRGNILRFPPVSQPASAHAQEHGFEKPVELCKFLTAAVAAS